MLANEHYVISGNKKLRCGYTTGSTATLASKAAILYLLSGEKVDSIEIVTPKGWKQRTNVIWDNNVFTDSSCRCGVKKDAGDDSDVTDGIVIYSTVTLYQDNSFHSIDIEIDGGKGVGRVTKAGLDQAVGKAAINSVPRAMIEKEIKSVCEKYSFTGKIKVLIDVPDGEKIAKNTFNPVLGIIGGISILGTTGVVEPMSVQALIDSLEVEMRFAAESNKNRDFRPLIITPGEYGAEFLSHFDIDVPVVKCSNYIGEVLDMAAVFNFSHVLISGHAGKLVKLAAGIFNTHSHVADCRVEILSSHAALCGANRETVKKLMDCATVDACIDILKNASEVKLDEVLKSIFCKIKLNLDRRIKDSYKWDFLMFSKVYGILAKTDMNDWPQFR
ncbi:MAG: cobalt-precorrin-5B (C(1))-methyltransferase CbiD [Treponema sp.]|nr:cobalt-precorrin-5B (C(1))-methyltransferase CbiD [Treponema sp.]